MPEPAAAAVRERSFLAFDFGTRRVGVASGNTLLRQARDLKTIAAEGDARFDAIARLIAEWQPDALLHAPWAARPVDLAAAGIELGRDYPLPVVQHEHARMKTLERYAVVKGERPPR